MSDNEPTYPLTFSQLLVWEGEVVAASHFTNLCALARLRDASDIERWREAIRQVIRENEGLRLRMVVRHEDVRQYVAPDQPVEIPFLDFSGAGGAEEFQGWVEREARRRLPVVDNPLFFFAILRLSGEDHRLLIKVHHLVSDAWTMTVLVEQILKHYALSGEAARHEPPASFVPYILQQTAPRVLDNARLFLRYVFERIASAPAAVRIRPELPRGGSVKADRKTFPVPPALRATIIQFSETGHTSAYLFFLSTILLEIALVNAAENAAIGTLFHNRLSPAFQNTVGLFNVILPLRTKVANALSFRDLIRRVLAAWKESIQRQPGRLSLQELVALYHHAADLFDVLVSYESHVPAEPLEWLHGDADLEPISLMVTILDYPAGPLEMEYLYRTDQYRESDIAGLHQKLLQRMEQLLADPDRQIGDLRAGQPSAITGAAP